MRSTSFPVGKVFVHNVAMLALIQTVLFVEIAAVLSLLFWSAGPWFLLFAWLAIAAAAWYQLKHPFPADPPER